MTPTQQASLFLAATRWCALVGIDSTGNAKEREEAYQVMRKVMKEIELDVLNERHGRPREFFATHIGDGDLAQQGRPPAISAPAEMGSQKRNR